MNSSVIPYINNPFNIMIIVGVKDRRINAILLTCKPGRRPVRIPVNTPRMQNTIMRSKSIIMDSP